MTGFGVSVRSKGAVGVGGKLFLSLFFFVFFVMGALFVWLVARDSLQGLQTWGWKPTQCEIITSSVRETDEQEKRTGGFYLDVQYRYIANGQTFTSNKHRRKSQSFSDYGKASRLSQRFPPESKATCYYNPAAPNEAILERGSLLAPLLILFPMIFVAIGAGGIYFTWRRKREVAEAQQPISSRAFAFKGGKLVALFFLFFLIMGAGFLYAIFLRPLFKIVSARQWPAVSCVVISSEVKSHSGDDGTTYSVNIFYSYEFNGREFRANAYDFVGGSSSGYNRKHALVNQHPVGSKTVCYVNPKDPTEAVLQRGFSPFMLFGIIPLVFVLLGAGGLIFTLRSQRHKTQTASAVRAVFSGDPKSFGLLENCAASESLVLKPQISPMAKFVGILLVALFWNGIVSVFLADVVRSWRSDSPQWFLTIFLIPFVAIGVGMIAGGFYFFLSLFNPRLQLTVTPGAVPLNGSLRVEWNISGRTEVIKRLRLSLSGHEEATYRRGTSTCTDKNVFANLAIADTTAEPEMRSGSGSIKVPSNLMHSFTSKNNKIVWCIQVRGEIDRWPDINEEFPLMVLPLAPKTPEAYE